MPSDRQKKVNSVIKRTLGEIILKELDLPHDVFATIIRVDSSPSLEHADIYLSIFPDAKVQETLKYLKQNVYGLQKVLNKKVVLKFVPKIEFKIDKGFEQEHEINEMLDSQE